MANRITGKSRKGGAGRGGNGRALTPEDNRTPAEIEAAKLAAQREREEAEGIQLLSVVARVKKKLVTVEAAAAKLKTEKDELGDIFRAAKTQSKDFERGRIMELVNDSKPAERRNVQRNEEVRARFRRLMGLPVGVSDTERELEARLPEVERNGLYWRGVGYTDGVSGADHAPPAECVGAGHDNRYTEGWKDGQAILGEEWKKKPRAGAASPTAPGPNPLDDPASPESLRAAASEKRAKASLEAMGKVPDQPDWTGFPDPADVSAMSPDQMKAFERWFDLVPADLAPVIAHPGVLALFNTARSPGGPMATAPTEGTDADAQGGTGSGEGTEGFEASPEELAAQAGRKGGDRDAKDPASAEAV